MARFNPREFKLFYTDPKDEARMKMQMGGTYLISGLYIVVDTGIDELSDSETETPSHITRPKEISVELSTESTPVSHHFGPPAIDDPLTKIVIGWAFIVWGGYSLVRPLYDKLSSSL